MYIYIYMCVCVCVCIHISVCIYKNICIYSRDMPGGCSAWRLARPGRRRMQSETGCSRRRHTPGRCSAARDPPQTAMTPPPEKPKKLRERFLKRGSVNEIHYTIRNLLHDASRNLLHNRKGNLLHDTCERSLLHDSVMLVERCLAAPPPPTAMTHPPKNPRIPKKVS